MKYYIIAGEASGDLHGSNLMKALYEEDKNADISFWGGNLMQNVGGRIVSHYKERAFMGFFEVLMNLFKILKFIKLCKKDIVKFQPDVIILIDNSGFNLPITRWAKKRGFKTNYYISPQVWASRKGRVKSIKKYIDKMFVILPFEKEFYKQYNYKVEFVGHPLIDEIAGRKQVEDIEFKKKHQLNYKPIIALLPGSRKQEIKKILSIMLSIIDEFSNYQFVVAAAPSLEIDLLKKITRGKKVSIVQNKTYDLLSVSKAALVTSGTATLETALFKIPQVVCYKANFFSYQIAKRITNLKFISLVNLIIGKEAVKELIQNNFNKENLNTELSKILNKTHREKIFKEYLELEKKLGGKGASEKVAKHIITNLKT